MDDERAKGKDQMMLGPDLGGGHRPYVRHLPDHTIDAGICAPVKEGKPMDGFDSILSLTSTGDGLYDVESVYEPSRAGPANVNSKSFRTGWERIFGGNTVVGSA